MAGGPDPVVLIDGSDAALVLEAAGKEIEAALGGLDRSLALEDHGGEEVDLAAVADACATPAFLVERRVVVVRDVGRYSTEELGPLLAYLEDPLSSTTLILVAGEGRTASKLVSAAKGKGRVVADGVERGQSLRWLHERLAASGIVLDQSAERRLAEHLGEDVTRLVALLRVVEAAYGPGARLTYEDLEPYLGEAGSVTPWAFTDAIDAGDTVGALDLLRRLLEGGERHPLVVLAIIHRHAQTLMRVDGPGIRGESDAAAALGIPAGRSTFPAKKALRSARQWGSANIAEAVGLIADAEVDLKGGSAWAGEAVLEVLVARLCRLSGSRRGAVPSR
jgi:DNA polymerase-3 subunit delta